MMTFDKQQSTSSDVSPGSDAQNLRVPADEPAAALARALHAQEYLSNLMAATGHDLRQPLHVIGLVLDLLEWTSGVSSRVPPLKVAREAIVQLSAGLDRLAFSSRLTQGSDGPNISMFPISEVLLLLESMWHYPALQKKIRLRIVASSARVTSDLSMLTSILGNLVGNAIKYTSRGGVLVGCRRHGDRLSIQVADSGMGIDTQRLGAVFAPFHQEDPRSAGLGLGLAIVRRSAEALGHCIRVDSVVGRGSVFSIDVPLESSSR